MLETARTVKHNTSSELRSLIRDAKAELDSRNTATPVDTCYTLCKVDEANYETFDNVVYAICTEGMSVTEVSTPERAGFIVGTAKNWVSNAGGLRKFKALFSVGDSPSIAVAIPARNVTIPEEICRSYLQSRKDANKGFTTKLMLVETGTFESNPFGIVQKPNGARWAIGDLTGKGKPQSYPMARAIYRKVDKATKGHRSTCNILVFDPIG